MADKAETKGNILVLVSFLIWGIAPVYWSLFRDMSPFVLVFNRFLWSALFTLFYLQFRGKLLSGLKSLTKREMALLCLQGSLLLMNWLAFAYSFVLKQTIQAGLGYAMNPLLNIAISVFFFKEKLRKLEITAIVIACASVLYLIIIARAVPTIALIVCVSFAMYGTLKKKSTHSTTLGLSIETTIAAAISGLFLIVLNLLFSMTQVSGETLPIYFLATTGLVTLAPLLLYGSGLRFIPFSRAAFFQFMVPMLITLVSIVFLNEAIPTKELPGYALMWIALMLYVVSLARTGRKTQKQ